jgi:hypothetical protein
MALSPDDKYYANADMQLQRKFVSLSLPFEIQLGIFFPQLGKIVLHLHKPMSPDKWFFQSHTLQKV